MKQCHNIIEAPAAKKTFVEGKISIDYVFLLHSESKALENISGIVNTTCVGYYWLLKNSIRMSTFNCSPIVKRYLFTMYVFRQIKSDIIKIYVFDSIRKIVIVLVSVRIVSIVTGTSASSVSASITVTSASTSSVFVIAGVVFDIIVSLVSASSS